MAVSGMVYWAGQGPRPGVDPGGLNQYLLGCLGWPRPGKGRALGHGGLRRGPLEAGSPDSWSSDLTGRQGL